MAKHKNIFFLKVLLSVLNTYMLWTDKYMQYSISYCTKIIHESGKTTYNVYTSLHMQYTVQSAQIIFIVLTT